MTGNLFGKNSKGSLKQKKPLISEKLLVGNEGLEPPTPSV